MSDDLRDDIELAIFDPRYFVDHDVLGYGGLEHSTDAVMAIVERHIAQARAETAEQIERVQKVADELDKPDGSGDRIAAGLIRDALTVAETGVEWRCDDCGADRWVGWRAGPKQDGFPLRAQCVPCGHVQGVPNGGM